MTLLDSFSLSTFFHHHVSSMNRKTLHVLFSTVSPALEHRNVLNGHRNCEFPEQDTISSIPETLSVTGHLLSASHESAAPQDAVLGTACLVEFYYQEPFQQLLTTMVMQHLD